jgi:tRNA (guanine-N7-)-methyltransferase
MAGKNKLKKFADIGELANVYENADFLKPELSQFPGEVADMAGNWRARAFANDNPIVLELACGRGEYTVALAQAYPDKNFIGMDIKGARLWQGANQATEQNMQNVAFIRSRIELLTYYFEHGEVDEIWITFPDPFLRDRKTNKRLTSPYFLDIYSKVLKPQGKIRLKTDNPKLYYWTLGTFSEFQAGRIVFHHDNIYSMDFIHPDLLHQTYYEAMHKKDNCSIKYVEYHLK